MSEKPVNEQTNNSERQLPDQSKTPLNLSLFELFRDAFSNRLTPLRATKVTLVDISHSLEELVIADRLPAMVFTGFQESSYWRKETDRYLRLAGIAHSVSIFAGGLPPEAPGSNYIHVQLSYKDTLRQEWFLLILTQYFSVLLCGRDRLENVANEAERAFDTLWTFEPDLIHDLVSLLARVVEHYRPERHAALMQSLLDFPPVQPTAKYVTLLTNRVVNHLERQFQVQRQQMAEQAFAAARLSDDQKINVALLPLFSRAYLLLLLGEIDYAELEDLAAKLVADLTGFKASHLFIDLSKTTSLEAEAAKRLVRLIRELNVCGIKAALSGVPLPIASVLVDQNLDQANLTTYPSLAEALSQLPH